MLESDEPFKRWRLEGGPSVLGAVQGFAASSFDPWCKMTFLHLTQSYHILS